MTNILPAYLAIGVSEEKFWDSTPIDLKPYVESYKLQQKARDAELWRMGMYAMSAVQTSLSLALNGKKSKAEYIQKPMLFEEHKEAHELTEEEMKTEREKFLMQLQIMQANFERNNENKADKET